MAFKRILCAVDFSEESLAAFRRAVELAHLCAARLYVMHWVVWNTPLSPPQKSVSAPCSVAGALPEIGVSRNFTPAALDAHIVDTSG
jgi:nucleotide-binding universal stress UspA family protein